MNKPKWIFLILVVLIIAGGSFFLPLLWVDPKNQPWVYQSPELKWAIELPNAQWKIFKNPKYEIAFIQESQGAIIGVQTRKVATSAFWQKSRTEMKKNLETNGPNFSQVPVFQEGVTSGGNPYLYSMGVVRDDKMDHAFVAQALVWCKNKGITVFNLMEVPFPGQPKDRDSLTEEWDHMARRIFLSVH